MPRREEEEEGLSAFFGGGVPNVEMALNASPISGGFEGKSYLLFRLSPFGGNVKT